MVISGARNLALAFMRSAAEQGMSFAETFRQMKDAGLETYRRTVMLDDYRDYLGIPKKAGQLGSMRYDYRPAHESYTIAKRYQHQDFRYEVKVDIYKPQTGETFNITTNVTSDLELTRRQMEEMAFDSLKVSMDLSEFEIQDLKPYAAFHREEVVWE